MPGKNLSRTFIADGYYHLYNRGVNKRVIFKDSTDYQYFTSLFTRHLNEESEVDRFGRDYKSLHKQVSVLAYCWMPNHFHILAHQPDERGIVALMMSVCTAYTMYFNKKYHRRGPLFENNYRASLIMEDAYLRHISRYIHLNPGDYKEWPHSSYKVYAEGVSVSSIGWLQTEPILELFGSRQEYVDFVSDYEAVKRDNDLIKHELADNY